MKKLLYITYVFPPTGGAGIQRNVKFIKYLARMGWEITVLTPRNPSVPTIDNSFSKDIPQAVDVKYTRTLEPDYSVKQRVRSNVGKPQTEKSTNISSAIVKAVKMMAQSILLPDVQVLWSIPSFLPAISVINKKNIDVIFSSAPPFSSLVFASWLSRITGVPYVADFRDEWVDFIDKYYDSHKKVFGRGIVRRMEEKVVKHAAAVTMASPSYVENLRKKYTISSDNIFEITNGFDVEDYTPDLFENNAYRSGKLTIGYFGSVINANTAHYFLEACRRLLTRKPEYKEQIAVHFTGRISADENVRIEEYLDDVPIVRHGYMEHSEVIRMMKQTDVLLVLVDDLPGAERMISGKIFEYLYSRKTVLAVVPQGGEVDRIVRTVGCGISCPPRDMEKIGQAVEALILRWEQGKLNQGNSANENLIQAYSREVLASRLSNILQYASGNNSRK